MKTFTLFLFLSMATCSNLFSQEITMFPGFWSVKYYQDDVQISRAQVGNLMMSRSESKQYWQKAKSQNTASWVCLGVQLGFLAWQIDKAGKGEDQTIPFVGVLGAGAVGIGFAFSSTNNCKKAILSYNKAVKNTPEKSTSLHLGQTVNGMGLVLRF